MSLYLKYRPRNFASVVGQTHAKKAIQNALASSSPSHAYLFCGPRGTGKTSLARIFAKGICCLNLVNGSEPCNECEICKAINAGRLVDLIEIDAASNRGIDEIRELKEKIVFAPSQARAKIYIIDEVHMLTKEAFNALLKTLEEPPEHAFFVLATTEAHKIPETIISRCQQFGFNRISVTEIVERLQEIAEAEGVSADEKSLELIAKLSSGGLRDAIGLLEQMMATGDLSTQNIEKSLGITGNEPLEKFFNFLVERKPLKAIELLAQLKAKGQSTTQFLTEVIAYFREQMLINLGSSKDTKTIVGFIDIFTQAKGQLDLSPIPELPIEVAIIKACEFEVGQAEEVQAAPVKAQAVPKPEEQGSPDAQPMTQETELDFKRIKQNWPRVLENIETPFIQMSLKDGEPSAFESEVLTIAFGSATFLEKISSSSNQEVVQRALEKVYGKRISLNLVTKKVELSLEKMKVEEKGEGASIVEMAQEVFGINSK